MNVNAFAFVNTIIIFTIGKNSYSVNDEIRRLDVVPYIDESSSRTMIPIRYIAEAIGASVNWDDDAKSVTITLDDQTISIILGKRVSENSSLDWGTPVLSSGRVFVPVRFVSEQLGAHVYWNGSSQTVSIIYPGLLQIPSDDSDYSSYTGTWICKEKATSLVLQIDINGNVTGSITTVVGTHVPSSKISGRIWLGSFSSNLDLDDSGVINGKLELNFNNGGINGKVILDKSTTSEFGGWTLADGDMVFIRYTQ